ncbi:ABC transporter [Duganella sp. Leaf126]|uniref:ABC transporter permease n=1 Tax=Duganella sp. Leaf126 TaxID=1736266 RepID=UPI0006F9C250|nr:ABC transporter permease [Duganella sp. Leaf126]KQQ33881.1 ABC transporter [Duganella sp. Leaf126]
MSAMLRALWHSRGFVRSSVRREFEARYRNTMLGAAWSVLHPLAMILVYTVIFSQVMHGKLAGDSRDPGTLGELGRYSYSIYLCAGILCWGLFAEIVTRAQNMFIENANLLKKASFPRICLPVIVAGNALLNFAIIFGLFTVFLLGCGRFPGPVFALLLPLLLLEVALALGLGLVLGVLNVFFRDVGQFCQIFIQFWFWLTPIVYPAAILPPALRALLVFNPMAAVTGGFQDVLLHGRAPDWASLLPAALCALALGALGLRLLRRRGGDMGDEL